MASATVNIYDNDQDTALVTVTASGQPKEFGGGVPGTFTFTRRYIPSSSKLSLPLTIRYDITVDAGHATNGSDYVTLTGQLTIPANQLSQTVELMPIDDAEVESTELVTITIHDEIPSYLGESSQSATLTILDNDPAKVWLEAVQDASEPDQKGKFKLWRDGGDISQPLSVNFTVDGSATLNTDYTGLAPTMVIPANVRVMYVDIAPIADDLEEGVEIIRATLGTSSAYTPQSPLQQSIRLYDKYSKTEERTTVSVVANDPTASEFGFSDGSYQFTRDGDLSKDLTVYFTLSGSADEEADFHPLSRAITFYPNQRQVTINLYPTIDNEVEGPETVIVSLAGGDGYTISKGSVTVTITDDPPVVSIVALQDAVEGGNVGKFVLYRTGGDLTQELGVFFTPAGTASQSEDYASTSSYHTFVADAWQTTLEIQPYKDNRVEGEETIRIAIDTNSSYLIEPLTAEAEITLHDTPAYVWISSGAAASEPATKGHFTVGRFGGDIDETLPVRITIGGTAKAGADYEAIYERVEIPAGKSTVDVDIVPLKDNDVEGTETVQITVLADPQTFFLLNDNVTVNLYDDPPTVNVEVVDNASEPASPGKFRFTRSGGDLSVPLTATFSLSGTATTGDDYETVTTSVSFAEGITFAYVYLNPRADNLIEGMEYAIAKVQPTSKYVAGWNGEAWLGINDDPPRVSIYHEADASEPDREGAFTLVREGGDLSQSMAVQLQVVGGTAVLGTDYENISSQVFIPAGVGAYSVRIKPIDDTEAEDDETIQVAIVANPTAYVIQNGWAQTLLHDDDQTRFVLTLDKGTINEGQSVTLTGTFDIDQNDWGPHLVTIDWADDSKADTIFLEPGDDEFELAHKYEDDGKLKRDANDRPIAGNNTPQDPHAILAKLQGFFTPVVNRSKTVTVKNVVPVKVVLQIDSPIPGPDGVIEIEGGTKVPDGNGGFRAEGGEGLILRGNVTDAGGQEWYDLAVDWGDGTGRKHQQQESPPQYRNGLTWASSIHGPSLAGEEIAPGAAAITRDIWVEIKANDDDQPDQTVSDKKKVRIRSLPPALMFDVYDKTPDGKLSLLNGPTPTHGFEGKPNQQGGTVYIEGAIVRSPSGKWNQVKWNWGDGSPEVTLPTVFDVATGAFKFTATHQYADNKPWNGVAYGQYDLKAKAYSTKYTETVLNKDDAVEIANVLPSKLKATFKEDEQDKNAVEIRGTFDDPGPKDPHTVEVKWDTLSNEPPIIISLPPGLTSFDPASQVFKDYEMNPEYAQYAGQLPQLKVDIESKLKHVYGELTGAGVTISVEVYDNDIVRVTNAKGKALFGQSAANGEILAKYYEDAKKVQNPEEGFFGAIFRAVGDLFEITVQAANGFIEDVKEFGAGIANFADGLGKLEKALSDLLTFDDFDKLITALLKNPTGFMGHLLTGVQQGFERFFDKDKIGDNLKDVALRWIAGKLGPEGIEANDLPDVIGVPADVALKNIAGFGLRLLHVTWDDLVGKLASKLGPDNLALLEQGFEEIKGILGDNSTEQDIQTRIFDVFTKYKINDLSAEKIRDLAIDAVKDFAKEKIPILIAKQIATFVNPAGGFGAALKLFGWFATNIDKLTETAKDLKKFVSTLANNAEAISNGNTEAVATAVEKAIKDVAPLVLDIGLYFLGLNNLPKDIAGFVRKQQKKIDDLINKVLDQLTKKAQELFDKIVGAVNVGNKGQYDGLVNKIKQFDVKANDKGKNEKHRLWVKINKATKKAELMLASNPEEFLKTTQKWIDKYCVNDQALKTKIENLENKFKNQTHKKAFEDLGKEYDKLVTQLQKEKKDRKAVRDAVKALFAAAVETANDNIKPDLIAVMEEIAKKACFVAGTPLRTPTGSKPIEEFRAGDAILSRDESDANAPVTVQHVEEVFERVGRVLNLHAGGVVIGTTAEHPFWLAGKGWIIAGEIVEGDMLVGHDGQETRVDEVFDTGCVETVYNLRVSEEHTYFVGAAEWGWSAWAHNVCLVVKISQTGVS